MRALRRTCKFLPYFFNLLLLFFTACFGDESKIDEDYHPGVPVLSAAKLTFESNQSRSAIDTGDTYNFGRVLVGNSKEISFTVKNIGQSPATDITASGLTNTIFFKGNAYPGTGGNCANKLEPGKACTLVLQFVPDSIELYDIKLVLTYGNGKPSNRLETSTKEITAEGYSVSPELSDLTPLHGPASGGTTLTLSGKYFRSGLTATLDGLTCHSPTVVSPTVFTCVTPAHSAGTVNLILTNEFGQSSSYVSAFTYYAAPTVTGVTPSQGALGGGTSLTISGTAFRNGASVSIGGSACTSVNVNSVTSITCTTSAHSAGATDIVVTNSDSQSGTGSGLYTYQAAPTVTAVYPNRIFTSGRTVEITGTGFLTGATVTINGTPCTSQTVNGTGSITCGVGAFSVGTYSILVTNSDTQAGTLTNGLTVADNDVWLPMTTTGAPVAQFLPSLVWTGSKLFVWGGFSTTMNASQVGGLYDPVTDSWSATSSINSPSSRNQYDILWTGAKALVWGGYNQAGDAENTGGTYDPILDTWSSITTVGVPRRRMYMPSIWTGAYLISWGGWQTDGTPLNDGGVYDPDTNTWTEIETTNAPVPRMQSRAVWTGGKMIVWGGYTATGNIFLNTGGVYNPETNSWTVLSTTNAPTGRYYPNAIWTGDKLLIWGGGTNSFRYNSGGLYDPIANSWTTTSTLSAPSLSFSNNAIDGVWTGGKLLVWENVDSPVSGLYDPASNAWTTISSQGSPSTRSHPKLVWSGDKMIQWGGQYNSVNLNTGGMYLPPKDPASNTWTAVTTVGQPFQPSSLEGHAALWTGSKMIIWGGFDGNYTNLGGLYDPVSNSWALINSLDAPSPRGPVAVWTGAKMIVWGGDTSTVRVNDGSIYDPATNTWSPMTTTDAPVARSASLAAWTGKKFFVFAGYDSGGSFNTGGLFDPATNTWSATSTTNAPPQSTFYENCHWTGSQIVLWGGLYNPLSNSWTRTTTVGEPSTRIYFSTAWTGSKLVIWGGVNGVGMNTGGLYDPAQNTWTSITTTNAPHPGQLPVITWTNSRVFVWGGWSGVFGQHNTAGLYDPGTDSWTTVTTNNAPTGRWAAKGVWTGSKIIIWGGRNNGDFGGVYTP